MLAGVFFHLTSWGSLTTLKKEGNYVSKYRFPPQPQGDCLCQHQQKIRDWKWLLVAPELAQHNSWNQTHLCVPMGIPENNVFLSVLLKWKLLFKNTSGGTKEIVGGSVKCSFSAYRSPGLGAWEGSSPGTTVMVEGCIFLQTSLSAHRIWNVLTNPTWEIQLDFSHLKGVVLDNRNS